MSEPASLLSPLVLTASAFQALPLYAWSRPTGIIVGKTWIATVSRGRFPYVIGRYEWVQGEAGCVALCWYLPAVIPDGATLEQRGKYWLGTLGAFVMCAPNWLWVGLELWRASGAAWVRQKTSQPGRIP